MAKGFLFSHATGNANVRAALDGLFEADILKEFHTTIASYPQNVWDFFGKNRFGRDFDRRKFDARLQPLTIQHPLRELGRMLATRCRLHWLCKHETGVFCIDSIYRGLDRIVARRLRANSQAFTGVYAYEDGALNTLMAAKEYGLCGIYDLPIGYWRTARKLLKSEALLRPEWAATLTGLSDSDDKLARKDSELALADRIFVASSFTKNTLQDFPGKLAPVKVIPYGFPEVGTSRQYNVRANVSLKLLFVGGLSQRKGIANLFEAVEKLKGYVKLTVVGHKSVENCSALNEALAKHIWFPSMSHDDILKLMKAQDVLIFPSLFEGFGLVITEAMSQGTPVITTERTAGPDLIEHGNNGWLTEAGSTEALTAAIENLLAKPELIGQAGKAAMETAKKRPWRAYGIELSEAINLLAY